MRNFILSIALLFSLTTFSQKMNPFSSGNKNPFDQSQTAPVLRNCFTVEMEEKLQQKYPNRFDQETFETELQKHLDKFKSARTASDEIYRITTIVHVIHNGQSIGSGPNISSAQVNSQIDVLNEDFRRLGGGFNDHPDGADIAIEFIPALYDPEGVALNEPGIHRYNGGRASWESNDIENNLKPSTYWDPEQYFNIWVVNFGGDLNGVLGYAQFPSLSGLGGLASDEGASETDGVIIGYRYFGRTGAVQSPYDLGRTTTHEVGHWLGLRHIWGDGNCSIDDYCADTPNASQPNYECITSDTCPGDGLNDMIENYMDYSTDGCMNIFTQDQKNRIRTVLSVSPRRKNLTLPPCEEASLATIGDNNATAPQWFTYTANAAEVITVSSLEANINTYLTLYKNCDSYPIVSVDDSFGTEQSEFSISLAENETVKIFWSGRYSTEEFIWQLKSQPESIGITCGLADEAILGENILPATSLHTYWYSFTQPNLSSKIIIDGNGHGYTVYTNSCSQLNLAHFGFDEFEIKSISQGEEIFISFDANNGDFTWTLNVDELADGEGCASAVVASEGINNSPISPYWFKYTMTEDFGPVTISSTQQNTVETSAKIYDGCNGVLLSENVSKGLQTEITLDLRLNDEILILWENEEFLGFEWDLSARSYAAGEICENTKEATLGINSVDDLDVDYFWHHFVVPSSNKKLIIDSSSNEYVFIVNADCENLEILFAGLAGSIAIGLEENQEIFIIWERKKVSGFEWTLSIEELEAGDNCSTALDAIEGINSASYAPRWYTFTMPENGALKISSRNQTEEDTDLFVYDGCNGNLVSSNDDISTAAGNLQSEVIIGNRIAGETFLINWASTWDSGEFSWELDVFQPSPGIICENPKPANVGLNTSGKAPRWYSYSMPKGGSITISSRGTTTVDTNLFVYADCNGNLLSQNDDINPNVGNYQSSVTLNNLEAGQNLLIFWDDAYSVALFNWNISLNVINAAPLITGQSFIVPEGSQNGDIIGTISASDPDLDPLIYSITSGNILGIFSINPNNGEIILADASALKSNKQITVSVTDLVTSSSAVISIEVPTILGIENKLFIKIYPNPAQNQFTIDGGGTFQWTSGKLTDLNGRIVKQIGSDQKIVSCENLPNGLYFLQLDTNNGSITKRVVIYQ